MSFPKHTSSFHGPQQALWMGHSCTQKLRCQ